MTENVFSLLRLEAPLIKALFILGRVVHSLEATGLVDGAPILESFIGLLFLAAVLIFLYLVLTGEIASLF